MNQANAWTSRELKMLAKIGSPDRAQTFLDNFPYRREDGYFAPMTSLREGRAHCFDGALIAACVLGRAGHKVFLIDLCANDDDDHILCAFVRNGRFGAVAKSNFPGLRFREPIYRSVRELAMSYFEFYFNMRGKKSLREYSSPVKLPSPKRSDWECDDSEAEKLLVPLARAKHHPFTDRVGISQLRPVDKRFFASQMVGVDMKGVEFSRGSSKGS